MPAILAAVLVQSIGCGCVFAQSIVPPARGSAGADAAAPLPESVAALLAAEPLPQIELSPSGHHLLLLHERHLLSLEQLAEPAVRLAGRRVSPRKAAAHAPREYYGLTLVDIEDGAKTRLALPPGAVIGYPSWSPDGSRFAFTLTTRSGVELWIGEPQEARVRPLAHSLTAVLGHPCKWTADSRRLLCTRAPAPRPRREAIDIDELVATRAQAGAPGQPTLFDATRLGELIESELMLIDSVSGQRRILGAPGAYTSAELAPSGAFMLVSRYLRPYPRIDGVDDFEQVTEIRNLSGQVVATLPASARAVQWRANRPATAIWVERRGGVDALMALPPPFDADPGAFFALPGRFSGLRWIGDTGDALVGNYVGSAAESELWHVDPDGVRQPQRVTSYPSSAFVNPVMTSNRFGQSVVRTFDDSFYLRRENHEAGRTFDVLERVALPDGAVTRVWSGGSDVYEEFIDMLSPDARFVLTRRESFLTAPNYFVSTSDGRLVTQLTDTRHPAPQLAEAERVALRYRRDDGVELGASLYLPPQRHGGERLPMVVWSYPRNVNDAAALEGLPRRSRFVSFERAFRLFFLLSGYAVLDDVTMPIVGDLSEANDTFIDQIVANADAAVTAAVGTGHIDAGRIGVAGHSYGAFMVANLLAHSDLFGAGIALSGAYNRTLTPFGFQTERRTLWEAPETYLAMSPFLFSHQIEAPLLLVHGLNDDNAGTSPMQSTQFYAAIRGNGGEAELLLLPWEGHSYRARESVLDAAAVMLDWFDRYLKAEPALMAHKENGRIPAPVPITE
jgi:dipeptidyl aminopeptidase/acylaminoacyl peptidase